MMQVFKSEKGDLLLQGKDTLVPLSIRWRVLLLVAYGALILARMPEVVLKGRFWAEEGRVFFAIASTESWHQVLLTSYGGYLNLVANLGGLLAWHAVPLNYAPYATIGFALAIQLCPAILLLTSRLPWLKQLPVAMAALLMVLMVPSTEEIWLSTIGSQVHLALCAGLILALENSSGAVGSFKLVLLAIAALSGPGSWLLTPLFAIRAVLDRSKQRIWQAATLTAAVLVQAAFFYSHLIGRAYQVHPVLFLDLAFEKHVLQAFLGPEIAKPTEQIWWLASRAHQPPIWPAAAMIAVAAILAFITAPRWRCEPIWLLSSAVVIIGAADFGAIGSINDLLPIDGAGRYYYAPQVLISLAILAIAANWRGLIGLVATAVSAGLLAVGIIYYSNPVGPFHDMYDGPGWKTELAFRRRDPSHRIASWPPSWHVLLPGDTPGER